MGRWSEFLLASYLIGIGVYIATSCLIASNAEDCYVVISQFGRWINIIGIDNAIASFALDAHCVLDILYSKTQFYIETRNSIRSESENFCQFERIFIKIHFSLSTKFSIVVALAAATFLIYFSDHKEAAVESRTISYSDIMFSILNRKMMHHSRRSDFLFWRTSCKKWMLCCKERVV